MGPIHDLVKKRIGSETIDAIIAEVNK